MTDWILHVDLDEFIAAVEVLRRPELADRPVVVGGDGDPTKRGVVSTANYVARRYGVHSAMPLRTAYKRCPEAVFLPVDADAYLEASADVMEILRSFPGVVQTMGWDEAFMAVETDDAEAFAADVQRAVLDRTRLWCSIGVGDSKIRAKLASGFAKPRGVFVLTADSWFDVMGPQPTEALWGIGTKTARKLAEIGVRTVEQLAVADEERLANAFGPNTGPWLRRLGTGEDGSPVTDAPHVARGHGRERTFQRDLTDAAEIRAELARLATEVMADVRREGRAVVRVVVKVRFAPFFTSTHGVALKAPTQDAAPIAEGARLALTRFDLDRPVRLLGVRVEFTPDPVTAL